MDARPPLARLGCHSHLEQSLKRLREQTCWHVPRLRPKECNECLVEGAGEERRGGVSIPARARDRRTSASGGSVHVEHLSSCR